MNLEQLEAALLDWLHERGIDQAILIFRDRDNLRMRSVASNPVDKAAVLALARHISKAIDGAKEDVRNAVNVAIKESTDAQPG